MLHGWEEVLELVCSALFSLSKTLCSFDKNFSFYLNCPHNIFTKLLWNNQVVSVFKQQYFPSCCSFMNTSCLVFSDSGHINKDFWVFWGSFAVLLVFFLTFLQDCLFFKWSLQDTTRRESSNSPNNLCNVFKFLGLRDGLHFPVFSEKTRFVSN